MPWYTDFLVIAFATVCAGAGLMYVLRVGASGELAEFEASRRNQIRTTLRKFGGLLMVGVGLCLIVGYLSTRNPSPSAWALLPWGVLLLLVFMLMCLALVDLRLTQLLRRDLLNKSHPKLDPTLLDKKDPL
jgi:hypothetical protein